LVIWKISANWNNAIVTLFKRLRCSCGYANCTFARFQIKRKTWHKKTEIKV